MHLSLLSEGYVSDSFNDAGSVVAAPRSSSIHFVALCRGIVVLLALAIPVGMTLLARIQPLETGPYDGARSVPSQGAIPHPKTALTGSRHGEEG